MHRDCRKRPPPILLFIHVYYGEPFVSKWRYKIPCVGVPNWKDKSTRCVLLLKVVEGREQTNMHANAFIIKHMQMLVNDPINGHQY